MINLASRDIVYGWGKFIFTGLGLGLLVGLTLSMAGIYRGLVDDGKVLLQNGGADLWVVQRDTLGPYAEPSNVRDDAYRTLLGVRGVAEAGNVTYLTMQIGHAGGDVRVMLVGFEPHKRLADRISAMYVDKLDGKIGGDFYDRFAGEWREEQLRLQREIDRHEAAEQSYMDEGVQILELASKAQKLFESQEPRQKRRLLNFLLSNCSWEDGEVVATFRQPFDLLAETNAIAADHKPAATAISARTEIWLPDQGSNLGPAD